jgi:hypothetical protein
MGEALSTGVGGILAESGRTSARSSMAVWPKLDIRTEISRIVLVHDVLTDASA